MKLHAWACISISAENNRPRGLLAVRRRTYFFFFLFFLFSQIDIKSNISSLPCFDSLRELLSIINVKTIRIYISIYFCFPFREVVRVISERSKTNDFVVPCKSCPSTDRVNGSILSILRDLIFLLFFFFFYVLVKKIRSTYLLQFEREKKNIVDDCWDGLSSPFEKLTINVTLSFGRKQSGTKGQFSISLRTTPLWWRKKSKACSRVTLSYLSIGILSRKSNGLVRWMEERSSNYFTHREYFTKRNRILN